MRLSTNSKKRNYAITIRHITSSSFCCTLFPDLHCLWKKNCFEMNFCFNFFEQVIVPRAYLLASGFTISINNVALVSDLTCEIKHRLWWWTKIVDTNSSTFTLLKLLYCITPVSTYLISVQIVQLQIWYDLCRDQTQNSNYRSFIKGIKDLL